MLGYIELERDPRVLREGKALVDNGLNVDVIGLQNKDNINIKNIDGINYIKVNQSRKMRINPKDYIFEYSIFFIKCFIKLLSLSKKNRYDIIYVHNVPDFLVFVAFFHKLFLSTKIILDVHDPMTESFRHRMNFRGASFLLKIVEIIEKLSWKFSDEIVTVNESCKILIEEQLNHKKNVHVVMNMPDESLFKIKNPIDKKDIFKDKFVLLYTGTLSNWYGLDIPIDSLKYLIKEIPNILIYIVGKGSEKENLKKLVTEKGYDDYVEIANSVPQSQIVSLAYSCSIGISPHRDIEFSKIYFSTKVAEFIYCGKTVICSRTDGILNYFNEDELFYFEPGNALDFSKKVLMAYNDKDLVKDKLMKSAKKIKLMDWEFQKKKLLEVLYN